MGDTPGTKKKAKCFNWVAKEDECEYECVCVGGAVGIPLNLQHNH